MTDVPAARPRVWVTRASPGAEATADRLRRLGVDPLVAPLLWVRPIPGGPIDLEGVGALAFTSANGVAAFAARCPDRDIPVFAVGAATASAARSAGFDRILSANGDVEALAGAILGRGLPAGAVLHLAPAEPAGDLVGALAAAGVAARRLVVYETVAGPADFDPDTTLPTLAAVLLHSPRASAALAEFLAGRAARALVPVCLSAKVAAPLAGLDLAGAVVAATPDEAALLSALATALERGRG